MFIQRIVTCFLLLFSLLAILTAEDRILGGREVPPDDLVYVVKLKVFYNDDLEDYTLCTATVISEHHVLTAAQCLRYKPSFVQIYGRNETEEPMISTNWTIYPGFPLEGKIYHDIAILHVSSAMTIPSVNLAANYTQVKADWVRVAGYGDTKYELINGSWISTEIAKTLMETYVRGMTVEDCGLTGRYPLVHAICFYRKNAGTLYGDVGGPSFARGKDGKWYQISITSFGGRQSSGVVWSIDTDVSYYCPWIEEITEGEVECQCLDPDKIERPF